MKNAGTIQSIPDSFGRPSIIEAIIGERASVAAETTNQVGRESKTCDHRHIKNTDVSFFRIEVEVDSQDESMTAIEAFKLICLSSRIWMRASLGEIRWIGF